MDAIKTVIDVYITAWLAFNVMAVVAVLVLAMTTEDKRN